VAQVTPGSDIVKGAIGGAIGGIVLGAITGDALTRLPMVSRIGKDSQSADVLRF